MPFRRSAIALFSLAIMAGTAANAQSIDQSCLVGGQRATGLAQIATNCPIGHTPALSEFRFGFFNGNHRFRAATIMPAGDYFEAAWADVGGEDPHFVEGRWLRIPEAQGGVVEAVVQGVADIPIPPGPANTTLVLSGFEFKREDGTDANIRTIAIQTDGARRVIRTVLLDDQNMNFETLGQAIGIGFLIGAAGAPDPNLSLGATSLSNRLLGEGTNQLRPGLARYTFLPPENNPTMTAATYVPQQVRVSDTNARPYRVRVAYLWVPNNRLANTRMVSGAGRTATGSSGRLPGETPIVLQGFSFHFGNSDHFIESFGVHLSGGAPVQTAVNGGEIVSWQDENRDDPLQWSVRFSELTGQPPSRFQVAPGRVVLPPGAVVLTPAPAATPAPPPSDPASAEEEEEEEPAPPPPRRRGRLGGG